MSEIAHSEKTHADIIQFVRSLYGESGPIPLHAPIFLGREKEYLAECVESTFVSSVGPFVTRFEELLARYCETAHAVAVVNGTAALFLAFKLAGVEPNDIVITQSLSFAATANAIVHAGGRPAFVDIDADTLSMSPDHLREFLATQTAESDTGVLRLKKTGQAIRAVAPMHTFGRIGRIEEIAKLCAEYELPLIEDAAEALGSRRNGRSAGAWGRASVLSFNGNKTLTTGGGGAILTNDAQFAARARHLSTTAKVAHPYEFMHDEVGYNLRMPNLNAALGVAQLEYMDALVAVHRETAERYAEFFQGRAGVRFIKDPPEAESNCWLNAVQFSSGAERTAFLERATAAGVMARAVWKPLHLLPMFSADPRGPLLETERAYETVVNLPSSPPARRLSQRLEALRAGGVQA
jgi:aminotransferase in exopolysaccharide biosynthesis